MPYELYMPLAAVGGLSCFFAIPLLLSMGWTIQSPCIAVATYLAALLSVGAAFTLGIGNDEGRMIRALAQSIFSLFFLITGLLILGKRIPCQARIALGLSLLFASLGCLGLANLSYGGETFP